MWVGMGQGGGVGDHPGQMGVAFHSLVPSPPSCSRLLYLYSSSQSGCPQSQEALFLYVSSFTKRVCASKISRGPKDGGATRREPNTFVDPLCGILLSAKHQTDRSGTQTICRLDHGVSVYLQ